MGCGAGQMIRTWVRVRHPEYNMAVKGDAGKKNCRDLFQRESKIEEKRGKRGFLGNLRGVLG
jgi:hypothetical protein